MKINFQKVILSVPALTTSGLGVLGKARMCRSIKPVSGLGALGMARMSRRSK